MKIWKISPGRNAMNWEEAVAGSCIFIGWEDLGDLSRFASQEELIEHYQEVFQVDHNPTNNGFTLWAFSKLIEPGDIIVANKGSRAIVGIGKVIGEYQYLPEEYPEYPNVRKVDWVIQQEVDLRQKMFPTKTLAEIQDDRVDTIFQAIQGQVEDGAEKWAALFNGHSPSAFVQQKSEGEVDFIDEFHAFIKYKNFSFSREMVTRFVFSLVSKPFVILSGISGTGKTKIAQLFAEFMSEQGQEGREKALRYDYDENRSFDLTLQPSNFNHTRMMIPRAIWEYLDMNAIREGVTVTLHFENDQFEEALMKQQMNGIRLGFRKGFMKWLKRKFQPGDTIYITFSNDGLNWYFGTAKERTIKAAIFEPNTQDELSPFKQHTFISVRPDWLDHHGILGYYNPITQTYQVTEMLKIMLRAQRYPDYPFFAILDEMNLAKVEYYFSDFLSCLESRHLDAKGEFKQEKVLLHQEDQEVAESMSFVDEDGAIYNIPDSIEIPQNLYLIGTVNVDETTYMFSPKVLDRAHVIECNEVDFEMYRRVAGQRPTDTFNGVWSSSDKRDWFTTECRFHLNLYKKRFLKPDYQKALQDLFTYADQLKTLMMAEGHSFGYRVFDEMFTFIVEVKEFGDLEDKDSFDIMILQKILPKLHGNRAQVESLLNQLFQFCRTDQEVDEEGSKTKKVYEHAILEEYDGDYTGFRFKRSAAKLHAMHKQLLRTGYCSFIQ